MTKEELEKEAREYLAEHSKDSEVFGQTFVAVDTLTAMVDFAEPREKRIAELEKENAELKDKLEILIAVGNTCTKGLNKQLAKAKELLTRFIMGSVYFNGKETDLVEEAEQFIREVEK